MKTEKDWNYKNKKVHCNNCDSDIIPINGKCPNCNLNFSQDLIDSKVDNKNDVIEQEMYNKKGSTNNSLIINERTKNTKKYKIIAITILILGFVIGINAGNTYKICSDYTLSYCTEEVFNGDLMLYCWIGTILFDLFIFGIHSICYRLDLLIDKK